MTKEELFEAKVLARDLFQENRDNVKIAYGIIRDAKTYNDAWRKMMDLYDKIYP